MKATPEDQLHLLDLQKVDAEIDLLNHKAKNLPEHSQIAELEALKQSTDSELGLVSIDEADVKREVAKAEADAEQVRSRKTRDEARLASGQGSAKDLEHLQHELVSLTRRVNDLEEIEVEISRTYEGEPLTFFEQMQTISHEMVHVKQFLRKQYPSEREAKNLEFKLYGKCFPWNLVR